MKFNITTDSGYKAELNLMLDADGTFTGTVVSADYGTGTISNGTTDGSTLKADVSLDGYNASFTATISKQDDITGTVTYGLLSLNFTGSLATS